LDRVTNGHDTYLTQTRPITIKTKKKEKRFEKPGNPTALEDRERSDCIKARPLKIDLVLKVKLRDFSMNIQYPSLAPM